MKEGEFIIIDSKEDRYVIKDERLAKSTAAIVLAMVEEKLEEYKNEFENL